MRACMHMRTRVGVHVYTRVLTSHGYAHVYYTSARGIIHVRACVHIRVCVCVRMNRYTLPRRVYLFSCVHARLRASSQGIIPMASFRNPESLNRMLNRNPAHRTHDPISNSCQTLVLPVVSACPFGRLESTSQPAPKIYIADHDMLFLGKEDCHSAT